MASSTAAAMTEVDTASAGALHEDGTTMLVPFTYNNPFWDGLQAEQRCYDVAGVELSLRQDWKPDGRGGSNLGFGASVYDAAFVLSHFLAVLAPGVLPGRSVLDIGTGLGLSSLACALSGASVVVATDGDAQLLRECTLPNLKRNMREVAQLAGWCAVAGASLPASLLEPPSSPQPSAHGGDAQCACASDTSCISSQHAVASDAPSSSSTAEPPPCSKHVHVAPLMWGNAEHEAAVVQCLEGSAPDVIVAADIVAAPYEESLPLLAESLTRLMGPQTTAYIAHKPRHICEERWFRRLGKAFHVQVLPREASIHKDFQRDSPIRILKIALKQVETTTAAT